MHIRGDQAERYVRKRAFDAYMRTGKPFYETLYEFAQRSGRYVWRTQQDERVRLSHAKNEGQNLLVGRPTVDGASWRRLQLPV